MAAIDLLPWRERQQRRCGVYRGLVIAALLLASVGETWRAGGRLHRQQQAQAADLAHEQQLADRLEAGLADLAGVAARHAATQARLRRVVAWERDHAFLARLLPGLSLAMPDEAVLHQVSFHDGSLALSGEVRDSAALQMLGNALSSMVAIERLTLDETRSDSMASFPPVEPEVAPPSGAPWRIFRLQGRVHPEGPASGAPT